MNARGERPNRTMLKIKTTKPEDKDKICSSLVEALHGKAASVAQDIGTEVLSKADGYEVLIDALKKDAFPVWIKKLEIFYVKVKNLAESSPARTENR